MIANLAQKVTNLGEQRICAGEEAEEANDGDDEPEDTDQDLHACRRAARSISAQPIQTRAV